MSDSPVLYEKRGQVAWITLNRPEQRNAVNAAMRDELIRIFTEARLDVDTMNQPA